MCTVHEVDGTHVDDVRLAFDGKELTEDRPLVAFGLTSGATVQMLLPIMFKITIKAAPNRGFDVEVSAGTTVNQLKQKIETETQLPAYVVCVFVPDSIADAAVAGIGSD